MAELLAEVSCTSSNKSWAKCELLRTVHELRGFSCLRIHNGRSQLNKFLT